MFPTLESFCTVMDQCTENYECLVIDNNTKSNRLQDQIFWYKAMPHEDFKLGAREFWELSKNLTDSDDEDDGKFDPNKMKRRGAAAAAAQITVKKAGTGGGGGREAWSS